MEKLADALDSAEAIASGFLVVGNHDTVTLLGVRAQTALGDHSRRISNLLLRESEDLDAAITDIVSKMEGFEGRARKRSAAAWGTGLFGKKAERERKDLLEYIEKAALHLKLQQTQLIKEAKLLERLGSSMEDCAAELEQCIGEGMRVLKHRSDQHDLPSEDPDVEAWYARLEKRLDDLSVSHAVCLQGMAQVNVLRENNMVAFDRAASAIANLLPICRNQMAIGQGMELLSKRIESQDGILGAADRL